MSIIKPTPTVVHRFHFRGNAYTFPVEAALKSQQDGGQLHIKASPGYWLTTVNNSTPQSEQTISYESQPDGSWLVQSTVTLLTDGSSLIDGTITLRDPLGESVVLLVSIETALFISDTSVTFGSTEPGGEALALLKISQQGADTPLALSVDNPDLFGLASGKAASNFAANLKIIPSFDGSFICIRYSPNQTGRHTGNLVITTPYDSQTIFLEGRGTGKANWFPLVSWPAFGTNRGEPVSQLAITGIQKILAVVLLAGSGWLSYAYRCTLVPGLCQSQDVVETVNPSRDTTIIKAKVSTVSNSEKNRPDKSLPKKINIAKYADSAEQHQFEKQESENMPEVTKKIAPKWQQLKQPGNKAKAYYTRQSRSRWRKKSAKSDERSDLEKELNNTAVSHQ